MRLNNRVLGNSKPKNSWQDLTFSVLLVLRSFIKNRLIMSTNAVITIIIQPLYDMTRLFWQGISITSLLQKIVSHCVV